MVNIIFKSLDLPISILHSIIPNHRMTSHPFTFLTTIKNFREGAEKGSNMSRYFNNSAQLLRGGGSSVRAATLTGASARSVGVASSISRALGSLRIPPPPAGALPAAALILASGLAYRYLTRPQEDDRIIEDRGTYWVVPGMVKNKGESRYNEARQGPLFKDAIAYLHKNYWFDQKWWGNEIEYDQTKSYFGLTGEYPANQIKDLGSPGRLVFIFPTPSVDHAQLNPPIAVAVPEENTDDNRVRYWYSWSNTITREEDVPAYRNPPLVGVRGIGSVIKSPGQSSTVSQAGTINAMAPMREIKHNATAKTSALINDTIGFLGEGFDLTRCYLGAIGNTYIGSDGKEKVIPKSQWKYAINDLASQKIGIRKAGKTRGRVIVHPSGFFNQETGRTIGWKEAGERLAKCLLLNAVEDGYYGARGKAVGTLARQYGFAAGPLGLDSLINLASGETPYTGLLTPGY